MRYYRKNPFEVAALTNTKNFEANNESLQASMLQRMGWREVMAEETYPARYYYADGDWETPIDPRTWERLTGLRAARASEWCKTCGFHQTQCRCGRARCRDCPAITTRSSKVRNPRVLVDIVCHAQCKRYFSWEDKILGIASTGEECLAYYHADWLRYCLHNLRAAASQADTYTIGGPDKYCSRRDFIAVLNRHKKVSEVKTYPPIPKVS